MSIMNKRQLHHTWTWFRHIKPWYFLLAAVLCGLVSVGALRSNNQTMADLRQAVYTADKEGKDVQTPLNELQAYVTAHMNTSLSSGNTAVYPPIQLQYTYQRLVESEAKKLQGSNDLYTEAQAYCQTQNPTDFSGRNRVPCIEQYVQQRGAGAATVKTIPASLYQFDFVSPQWSPDVAGWSLVATVLFALLAVIKFAVDRYIKKLVR